MRATWKRVQIAGVLLLCLGATLAVAPVHAQTAGANIEGRVTDSTGAVLPAATVTAVNPATGLSRETLSDERGFYRLASLPVGVYTITTTLQGFTTQVRPDVTLRVGTTTRADFSLEVGALQETMTVTGDAPLVRTSEGSIGTVVTNEHVENLPLNGRQFANLAVFTPGVQLGFFDDPTKTTTLSINANGGAGRQVAYNVDGGDNNEDIDGGYTSLYSLEAVQEFVVQTQAFKAEHGGTNAAVVNIVTKNGTNNVDGSVFGLFRQKALNSRTTSEKLADRPKQDYTRNQLGGSIGGPIRKDRAHYFVAVERLAQDLSQVFNSRGIAPELDGVYDVPLRQTTFFAKTTFVLPRGQNLYVRYGYENFKDTQGSAPTVNFDFTGTNRNLYHNFVAGHTWVKGMWLNELGVSFNKWNNDILPNADEPVTMHFPTGVSIGWNADSLPQSSHIDKWTVRNDITANLTGWGGSHGIKFGASYFDNGDAGGEFSIGRDVTVYRFLDSDRNGRIADISRNGGEGNIFSSAFKGFGVYAQDDWKIGARLTLNLGVRYDYIDGLDLDQSANPLFNFLANTDVPAFARDPYLQGPIRAGQRLDNDSDNLQPRVGFAYDLKGDGTSVLRGGAGIYVGFPNGVTTIAFPSIPLAGRYGAVYSHINQTGIRNADGSFYRFGQPLPPNQVEGRQLPVFDEIAAPNLEIPHSRQYALAFSQQLREGWVGEVSYVRNEIRKNTMRYRANYRVTLPDGTIARRFAPFSLNEPRWRTTICCTFADYDGLNFDLRARLSAGLIINAYYTLSRVEGTSVRGTDQGRVAGGGFGSTPDAVPDPMNPFGFAGPTETDARHLITLAGVLNLPGEIVVAPIFRARSATPYAVFTGRDDNQDGFNFDLPPGVTEINSRRGSGFSQFDLRISKGFTVKQVKLEGVAQIFNLLNAENPSRYNGNMSAAAFGTPTAYAGDTRMPEQRLAEVGLRVKF